MKPGTKLNKKSGSGASSAGWKYFDDCLVCQAMGKADKQGGGLQKSQRKAEETKEVTYPIGLTSQEMSWEMRK